MILLEVLIALTLIAMCALPLIYPHIFLLQAQRKFVKTIELDHYVNLMYGDVFQRMHTGDISWNQIQSKEEISIDDAMLMRIQAHNLPKIGFKGSYHFGPPLRKKAGPVWGAYVIPVIFKINPEATKTPSKLLSYEASVYVLRQLPAEETVKETVEEPPKKNPAKEDSSKDGPKKKPQKPFEELAET